LVEFKEKIDSKGNFELFLQQYNLQQKYYFHANHIRKDNPLCSIHSKQENFDDNKFLFFEEEEDLKKFTNDLTN